MQVDGEACKLAPSIITLSRLNQATMLAKKKPGRVNVQWVTNHILVIVLSHFQLVHDFIFLFYRQTTLDQLKFTIHLITMSDYEQHHYDKELLKQAGKIL